MKLFGIIIAGVAICLLYIGIFVGLVQEAVKNEKDNPSIYDERQERIKGKAYKIGFFSLLGYIFVYGILSIAGLLHWIQPALGMFIGVFVSVTIFADYCILHDAFTCIHEKLTDKINIFVVLGLLSIGSGIIQIKSGGVFKNGVLQNKLLPFFAGVMFLSIFIVGLIKYYKIDKKGELYE